MKHNPEQGHRPKNYCRACGADFTSIEYFDVYRVGEYGVDRRCLSSDELLAKGYVLENGYWFDPARKSRAKQAFGK